VKARYGHRNFKKKLGMGQGKLKVNRVRNRAITGEKIGGVIPLQGKNNMTRIDH